MDQTVDPREMPPPAHPWPARRRWMAVLARADAGAIDTLLHGENPPNYSVLRGPEGGLVMVRGRAGGGGSAFNLGEMTVTRCTIRTDAGLIGHAYIAGRDGRRAELAALVDAMMQDPVRTATLDAHIITPLEASQTAQSADRAAKAGATTVQFFAMQTMRT
jgi:alpha-D-ribose 1-methylphosphonate 5-triphosphate synthase subunit PhnG